MSNLETVQQLYQAFGRGDVPEILSKLSDNVEWEYGSTSTSVPWLQRRQGREAVAGFFKSLEEIEMTRFVPKEFFEKGDTVVVLLDVEFTVRSTGKGVSEEDQIHIWRFSPEGKVIRFRHRADTHQHELAYAKS